jgi:hypothetical protein
VSPQVIQQEAYEYNDPITDFVECLFVNYDFDGAQQKLIECETLIENDYFLTAIKAEFLESARLFIFETYCRWVRGGRAAAWGRGFRAAEGRDITACGARRGWGTGQGGAESGHQCMRNQ